MEPSEIHNTMYIQVNFKYIQQNIHIQYTKKMPINQMRFYDYEEDRIIV